MISHRLYCILTCFVFIGCLPILGYCQQVKPDQLSLDLQTEMASNLKDLSGKYDWSQESYNLLAKELGALKRSHDLLPKAFKDAMGSQGENQKQAYIDSLLLNLCQLGKDNCDLRLRIEELETEKKQEHLRHRQMGELQRQMDELQRLDEESKGRRQELIEGGGQWQRLESPIELAPIPFEDPDAQGWQPVPREEQVLSIYSVVRRLGQICSQSTLVRHCYNVRATNGIVYHGDVYRNCDQTLVLVMHQPVLPGFK